VYHEGIQPIVHDYPQRHARSVCSVVSCLAAWFLSGCFSVSYSTSTTRTEIERSSDLETACRDDGQCTDTFSPGTMFEKPGGRCRSRDRVEWWRNGHSSLVCPATLKMVNDRARSRELDGASGAVFSPDGTFLYVSSMFEDTITVFRREPGSTSLRFAAVYRDHFDIPSGLDGAHWLAMSPDGRFLYVGSKEVEGVAICERDARSGALRFVARLTKKSDRTDLPLFLQASLSGNGKILYAPSGDSVFVFRRDEATGLLTHTGTISGFLSPETTTDHAQELRCLVASADGRQIYVGTRFPATVVAIEIAEDGGSRIIGVEHGRFSPRGTMIDVVSTSEDGAYVYAIDDTNGAVDIFRRDAGTGALAFEDAVKGPQLTDSTYSIREGKGGRELYIAVNNGLITFRRDPATGKLAPFAFHVIGADGEAFQSTIAVAPEGTLYLAMAEQREITIFKPNGPSGEYLASETLLGRSSVSIPCASLAKAAPDLIAAATTALDEASAARLKSRPQAYGIYGGRLIEVFRNDAGKLATLVSLATLADGAGANNLLRALTEQLRTAALGKSWLEVELESAGTAYYMEVFHRDRSLAARFLREWPDYHFPSEVVPRLPPECRSSR
jgi:6-phosphogluconolactonase (cycloisomerase 2 family)